VDAERGYSEERWYAEDRGYSEPDWREPRGESRRGGGYDDDRRAPAQRGYPEPGFSGFGSPASPGYADPGYGTQREPAYDPGFGGAPASPPAGGLYGARPGDRPAPPPEPTRSAAGASGSRSADDGVYHSRKPMHAVVLGLFLGVFELIMLLQFVRGLFAFDLHRVLSGGLTLMALPAFGIGFYALLTGAAHGGPKAFLKTPLAYLPVGLILLVAAGAAA
jgi:hypothetical protein